MAKDAFEGFGKPIKPTANKTKDAFAGFGEAVESPTKAPAGDAFGSFGSPVTQKEEASSFGSFGAPVPIQEIKEQGEEGVEEFFEGLKRGMRQELIPFQESKQQLKKEQGEKPSLSRIAGEAVGGIGTGIAAATAAAKAGGAIGGTIGSLFGGVGAVPGAAIGALVGGGVGVLGYALYSGFGQEYIQSELAGQEFSPGRAVARSALQINPVLKVEGRAAATLQKVAPKIAKGMEAAQKGGILYGRAAAQAAGEGLVAESVWGKDAGIVTGLMSALLGTAVFRNKKSPPTTNNADAFDDYLKSPVGQALAQKTAYRAQKEIPENISIDRAVGDSGFIDYVLTRPGKMAATEETILSMSEKAKKARFQRLLAGSGGEGGLTKDKLGEMYKGFLTRNIAMEEAGKARQAIEKEFTKQVGLGKDKAMGEPFGNITNWFGDAQLVARATDRKLGTNTTTLINKLAETKGEYEVEAAKLFNIALKATKAQKKLKLSNEDMGRLRVFISEKDPSIITPSLRPIVDTKNFKIKDPKVNRLMSVWDDAFEAARDTIRSKQYELGNIDHYIPMKMVKQNQIPIRIRRSLRSLQGWAKAAQKEDSLSLTADDFKKMGVSEANTEKLMNEIGTMKRIASTYYKIPKETVTAGNLGGVVQDLLNKSQDKGFGYEMSAMFSRKGERLSEKYRDLDIGSSFVRYVQSQVRGAIFDDIHRKLMDNVEVLRANKAFKAADWFQDHLKDITTGQQVGKNGVANFLQDSVNKYKYWVDKTFDDLGFKENSSMRTTAKAATELASMWQANLYPAYLGLNTRAHLRNLTQVLAVTAPELGGAYGYTNAAKAYTRLAKALSKGTNLTQELETLGLGGSRFLAEKVQKDVSKVPGTGIAKGINDGIMAIYSMSDIINRATTYRMGQIMAEDLLTGKPAALKALKKMGKATRAQLQEKGISEAIKRKDVKELGDILGKSLVAKTQFHYGPEQRARVFRFLGPMFSMFTKWPSSVGANIVDIWQENPGAYKKLKRYSEVYGAQLGLLAALGHAIREHEGDDGLLTYLIGNPEEVSPLASLNLSLINNPTMEALTAGAETTKKAISRGGDKEEIAKGLAKKATKKLLTTAIPPVSSVINELERIEKKGRGEEETSVDEALGDIFD